MIQGQTLLDTADNSGAKNLMCIRIIGASNQRYAHIGNIVVAVIKEVESNLSLRKSPIKKSEVIRAVIVRTRKELKRKDGMMIRYDENAVVIIDPKKNPRGSRISGLITEELRRFRFIKILSLAPDVL